MGVRAEIGGSIVESLGRALWKNADIPPNAMKPLIETSDKTASQIIDAIKTETAVGDQMKKAFETNNYEALNAGAGMLDDVSKSTRNKKNVEDLTKLKSEAALAREQKKLDKSRVPPEQTVSRDTKGYYLNQKEHSGQGPGMADYSKSRQFQIDQGDHAIELDMNYSFNRKHSSFNNVEVGKPSILVQGMEMLGVELGDSAKNINNITGNLTKQFRRAEVSAYDQQFGGVVHRDTINDALGMSNFNPAEISSEGAEQLGDLRAFDPAFKDISVEQYMDLSKDPATGRKFPKGSFGGDVVVYAPDNTTKGARTELGRVPIKSEADKANAMYRVFDILEENKIPNVKEARAAYSPKKILIDPKLAIYGIDHSHKHKLINQAAENPKTAIGRMVALDKTNKVADLSNGEALKVWFKSIQEQETILANQHLYRYEKIIELWHEDPVLKHLHWDRQPPHVKQNFYMLNINKIAVKGGNEKLLNLNKALEPIDMNEWPEGLEEIIEWSPQSLNVSDAKLEEVAQKLDGVTNISDLMQRGLGQGVPYSPDLIQ